MIDSNDINDPEEKQTVSLHFFDNIEDEQNHIQFQEPKSINDADINLILENIFERSKCWKQPVKKEDLLVYNESEFYVLQQFRELQKDNNDQFTQNIIKNIKVNKNTSSHVYDDVIDRVPKSIDINSLQSIEQKVTLKPKSKKRKFLF